MSAPEDDTPDELLDRIYEIAIDPGRLENLLDTWHARLSADGTNEGSTRFSQLLEPLLADHIARADQLLQRLGDAGAVRRDSATDELNRLPMAALLVARNGRIACANAAATAAFDVGAGGNLDELPLSADDREQLTGHLNAVFGRLEKPLPLLRFRLLPADRLVLVQIRKAANDHALVTTSELEWPDHLDRILQDSFDLTAAEQSTLRSIVDGHTAVEIASARGRSEATIRTHIQAILNKTGTRSQTELVRLTMGLLSIAHSGRDDAHDSHFYPQASTNFYQAMKVTDGRRYEYMLLGARGGRPFLWLPSDIGIARWTGAAEAEIGRRGITMVVPVRAGYGGSSQAPRERDVYETAAGDLIELLDHLAIHSCPIVTISDDFRIALELASRAPERLTGIIGCGASMPATRPEHYWRMPKWHRFVRGNARYAPVVLPFIARACFGLVRRIGKRAFMQKVLASAPADLAALEDDALLADLVRGSEISVSDNFSAHDAFSREAVAFQVDWTPLLANCRVPITIFVGRQDPDTPFETLREYCDEHAHLKLVDYPDEGHFVTHTRWSDLLALIEGHMPPRPAPKR